MSNECEKYSEEAEKYVGLSLAEARERAERENKTVRVLEEDGEAFFGTCDWDLLRVNFAVLNNKVVRAWAG